MDVQTTASVITDAIVSSATLRIDRRRGRDSSLDADGSGELECDMASKRLRLQPSGSNTGAKVALDASRSRCSAVSRSSRTNAAVRMGSPIRAVCSQVFA